MLKSMFYTMIITIPFCGLLILFPDLKPLAPLVCTIATFNGLRVM